MDFNPNNKVVKLCLQGMGLEEKGNTEKAGELYHQARNEAADDYEKLIAAFYTAQHQNNIKDKLHWLKTALRFASNINDDAVKSAFPFLYSKIAECYEEIGDVENVKKNNELAKSFNDQPTDKGPFYHGTKADLKAGDLLTAGSDSNYKPGLTMNHIYFTALVNGAGLAAELAKGDGSPRVYIVEPTGNFENDPNVTNKKFPGNPTRSYRSKEPLRIIGEIKDWARLSPEELQNWKNKLADNKGDIIN